MKYVGDDAFVAGAIYVHSHSIELILVREAAAWLTKLACPDELARELDADMRTIVSNAGYLVHYFLRGFCTVVLFLKLLEEYACCNCKGVDSISQFLTIKR